MHADASTFAKGVSKEEALQQVLDQAAALFDGQRNWVCRLTPVASGHAALTPWISGALEKTRF